jgi:lysine biosynthesis protein LysW
MFAACPNCCTNIKIESPEIGQRIVCPDCQKKLVIVWLFPIELDFEEFTPIQDQIDFFFKN